MRNRTSQNDANHTVLKKIYVLLPLKKQVNDCNYNIMVNFHLH